MAFTSDSLWSGRDQLRQRGVALVLTVVAHILLLLLLLHLASVQRRLPGPVSRLVTFNVLPQGQPTPARAHAIAKASPQATVAVHAPAAVLPPDKPSPTANDAAEPWVLNPELQRFSLSQVPHADRPPPPPSPPDHQSANASDDTPSVRGADGTVIYRGDWYRLPTHAELATYLPPHVPEKGWGEIVCRTAERYRVEDCNEYAEYPAGSGFARALREAAWQFLVRPTRINGHLQFGEPVLIHLDWGERHMKPD